MNKLIAIVGVCVVLAATLELGAAAADECPLASQVNMCSPKCKTDSDCLASGKRCCSNLCNTKSCVLPKSGSGSKGNSGSSATGTYCGNTKCNTGERCEMDKSTKRMQCKRT